MAKKKPSLKKALQKVNKSSSRNFGTIDVDIDSLPCLNKPTKEKITANFDTDLLAVIRSLAQKNKVSYTTIMNDVLRQVFIKD